MTAELQWVRVAFGIIGYRATLGLVTIATYALWAAPQRSGLTESWPLVLSLVVAHVGTVLVVSGISPAIRACAGPCPA